MPKRMLKDWTASEPIDGLTPQAEVFFTRLIMKADDFGVFPNNDRLLKSTLFPLKDYGKIEVGAWKNECLEHGIIYVFEAEGKEYLAIKNFDQRLRRMHHTYPPPPVGQVSDTERTSVGQVSDNVRPEVRSKKLEEKLEVEGVPFDEKFEKAFDEITCERFTMTFPNADVKKELAEFRVKCDNDPADYHRRDTPGLRNAFQYQLKQAKTKPETKRTKLL